MKEKHETDGEVRQYQKAVFTGYLDAIGIPQPYTFPQGNPIRPLPPVHTQPGSLMIIGAYPSAKFEKIKGHSGRYRNVAVANNLHPFADEMYFDGTQVRELVSGRTIREYFLNPLGLSIEQCWVTDLVKVFLYKASHKAAIRDVFPHFEIPVLREQFKSLGFKSMDYIHREVELCKPQCIVTLGEEVAQVVLGSNLKADRLLTTEIKDLDGYNMINCPHPDACRQMEKWRKVLTMQLPMIRDLLSQ